ncbi:MAG: class I SAM-dependent methyltransferase, partial [Sphingomonadales bacterium]
CTAAQMSEPVYAEWCHRLGTIPWSHRKQWEFIFIARALEYYGALRDGSRGLGFGVGVEPMPSVFAAAGCHVLATDLPAQDDRALVWNATDQLGTSLRQIHQPQLCPEDIFYERVSYRAVDMNAIPADLVDFDFTWSSCAYEHLGSIKAGLAFFENSIACLKPGGIAVHTTELNLSSNSDTLDHSSTVIFRRRDFEALAERLVSQGHDVIPITFDSGQTELDRFIDLPPYSQDSHLRLALLRWVATSFGMIVRKKMA